MVARIRLSLLLASALVARTYAQDVADFHAARHHVVPDIAADAWREVPWRVRLSHAALEADRVDKPIVLWVMNGHPLGCT